MRFLSLAALLTLMACAATPPPSTPPSVGLTRNTRAVLTYGCADGTTLITAYLVSPDAVEITLADGAKRTLPNVIAASGARYAAGGTEFWSKGESALYTAPGRAQTICNVAK